MEFEEYKKYFLEQVRSEAEHNGNDPENEFIAESIEKLEDIGELADVYEHDQDNCEIDDYYQIFGHSQQETDPIIKDNIACLDCRKAFILTDDRIIVNVTD